MSSLLKPEVKIIENSYGGIIYNAITGDNLKINADSLKVIKLIKEGITVEEIKNKYNAPKLDSLLEVLANKKFFDIEETQEITCKVDDCTCGSDIEQVKKGKMLQHLRLNVTEACNLDCSYCYERCSNIYAKNRVMSWEIAKKAIDEFFDVILENNQKNITIRFFGGEPLINWKLIKRSLEYIDDIQKGDVVINYIINTNGTLLNEEIAALLSDYKVSIALSLDGVGEYHDKTRAYLDGKGSFDVIDNNIKYLTEAGCIFNFSLVCTDCNYSHLNELIDYLKEKQDTLQYSLPICFNNIQICDRRGIVNLSTEEKVKYLMDAIRYAKKQGVSCYGGLTHFVFEKFINKHVGQHCGGVGSEVSIDPIGDVFPCSGLDLRLGNIQNFKDIFNSEEYMMLISRKVGNIEECKGCEIEGYCAGGCFAEFMSNEGKEANTYRDCDLEKRIFQELTKEYILTE